MYAYDVILFFETAQQLITPKKEGRLDREWI